MSDKKLVIVGTSAFAEVAAEYFDHDSDYEVVAFTVERDYIESETLNGRPVVAFEELESQYPPGEHAAYVAITYNQLNRLRARLMEAVEAKGYPLASYVSSQAFVWRNAQLGKHCFIMENNVVQPFVTVGDNVVMWSGNHIGHHSAIEANVFISSHVVVSGFCRVGAYAFLGVNCTLANNITIGADSWIAPNCTLMQDVAEDSLYRGGGSGEPAKVGARRFFKVKS